MELANLKVGDRLIVRNGARGEQIAVVAAVGPDRVRAYKWLARGARWTNRVAVYPVDVLRYATPADFKKRKVAAMAPVGAG